MSYHYTIATAVIADGQTQSSAVDLEGYLLVGLSTDAAFDAEGVAIDVSHDGVTFVDGIESIAVADDEYVNVPVSPARFVKVTAGAAQDGADSTITFYLRSN